MNENSVKIEKPLEILIQLLKKDERLLADGNLAKNKVIKLARRLDKRLLKLLKSSPEIKKIFLQEVDDILIFDKIKFQSFISKKQFLPDSFTSYKNKIGLFSDRQYLIDSGEVLLVWPYKDCILEGSQTKEDAKRNEIFWNETLEPDEIEIMLKPKVITNFKRYDKLRVNCAFEDGGVLEPDYVLFLQQKKSLQSLYYQIFIEPKGIHLKEKGTSKEKFLLFLKEKKMEKLREDQKYVILGMPFYNKKEEKNFNN